MLTIFFLYKQLSGDELIILADENISHLDHFFGEAHRVLRLPGRKITRDVVAHTAPDAVLVRSVTRVDTQLLAGSKVKFVGSATIGVDHIDLPALKQLGIAFAHAPGCNAQAVAEYVISAIGVLNPQLIHAQQDFCFGVVGYGQVGRRLVRLARLLNWRVMVCDPLLQQTDIVHATLDELLKQAHALSLHVPLTHTGLHATHHMISEAQLALMRPDAIVINTSRGAVISEAALLADAACNTQRRYVLDVFEHEPVIDKLVLQAVALATPHIAGYSVEGKLGGTRQVYEQWCAHFGFASHLLDAALLPAVNPLNLADLPIDQQIVQLAALSTLQQDDAMLRARCADGMVTGDYFDALRRNYSQRREWQAYGFTGLNQNDH